MAIFKSAIQAFRANILILCLVPIFDLGVSLIDTGFNTLVPKMFLWTYVLFLLHRTILLGSPSGPAVPVDAILPNVSYPKNPPFKMWVLVGGLVVTMIALMVGLINLLDPLAAALSFDKDQRFGLMFMFFIPIYWLILALFGTAIPATALNHETSLWAALRRARYTVFSVAFALLLGPGLIILLSIAALVFFEALGVYSLDWSHLKDFTPLGVAIEIAVLGPWQGFAAALTAAILSHAYLRGLKRLAAQAA
ncbi:MAG: hypothetical protein R8G34_06275 [Paracoccaceae bacterium]|nr:hypothetical protein [Paracoccaceae bacterium]